jgi:WD40 repeat protein
MRAAFWVGVVGVLLAAGPAAAQPTKPEVRAKLLNHRGGVGSVAFSLKGDMLATGSGNGLLRVWDAGSGMLIVKLEDRRHNPARINLVAFSGDGHLVSAASKAMVGVWDITDPKKTTFRDVDSFQPEAGRTGAVTGDGNRVYFTGTENGVFGLRSYDLYTRINSANELPAKFVPWALGPIPDPESGLVAVYGLSAVGDRPEPAVALVGLGDPRIVGRGFVKNMLPGRPPTVGFSPDSKWLIACNGAEVMYWHVPGSQVVGGDPKTLRNVRAYLAAGGPDNRLAVASPPEEGKKSTVTIYDLGGTDPKPVVTYSTDIDRISALAFSPDGMTLAVGDDVEGTVQLWNVGKN